MSRQAQRNINDGFHDGPSVGNLTEEKKRSLYSGLPRSCVSLYLYLWRNVSGISESSYRTLSAIGRRIVSSIGDKRAVTYLKQRLSIAVQRANAACIAELCTNTTDYQPTVFFCVTTLTFKNCFKTNFQS